MSIVCIVSRVYQHGDKKGYWFGFHPYQRDFLKLSKKSYVVLGCGDKDTVLVIDFHKFEEWLQYMNRTEKTNRSYWHVHIYKEDHKMFLSLKNDKIVDITENVI